MEIAIDAMESGAKQTLGWLGWQASRQASRLWKLQQRRDLARMRQASRPAAKERHAWLG